MNEANKAMWRSNLNRHILDQHERIRLEKKKCFKCNLCGFEYWTGSYLIAHMRSHTGERPFKCTFEGCGMEFKEAGNLKRHIKYKHSMERPFKCESRGCLYTAKTCENLSVHMKVHSDDRSFACSYSGCNFRTKRKPGLSRHTSTVHSSLKKLSCSKCNHRTNYARSLAGHMIVHEGRNENMSCSIQGCKYKGKNGRALKQHMSRHKKLLPCPVSGCGRLVTTKEALKDHAKLHDPLSRPFQCPFCLKLFPALFQLQKHCAVHINEKPFVCGHCAYAASFQSFVKTHISRAHTNVEFPFIVHLLDERECLHCKVTMPTAEFLVHYKSHGVRL